MLYCSIDVLLVQLGYVIE